MMKKLVLAASLLATSFCYANSPQDVAVEGPSLAEPLKIEYPPRSQQRDEEGTVYLRLRVQNDGNASEVVVSKSSGYPALDAAAMKSAQVVKFVPAKNSGGTPIASTVVLPVQFKLLPAD